MKTVSTLIYVTLALLIGGFAGPAMQKVNGQTALTAPFTEITTGPVVSEWSMWTCPIWGDFDNDGWVDLFVATYDAGGRNALYRNNKDGTFSKVTTGPLVTEIAATTLGASCADYDNDGWLDIVVSSNARLTQPSRLYRNLGGGSFARMQSADIGTMATDLSHGFSASWADYNRDGYLDLYIANGSIDLPQPDFLYRQQADGRFVRITNAATSGVNGTAAGSWADFDNDGIQDLLVVQLGSSNELYRVDAQGRAVDVTGSSGINGTGQVSFGAAWGDYDNDGDLDLVIINMGWNGPVVQNRFYRNEGNGTFARFTTGAIAEDQDHFATGSWVDYDNDGWIDLFVTILGPSSSAGSVYNRLYRNQGNGTFALVTQGSLVTLSGRPGSCAAWADYDNDGFLDVVVTYGALFNTQRNALFHNNGNTNNWIKIRCVGMDSNRSAIGAKVRVKATIGGVDRWQMRQIGSQDWAAVNSLETVFGLGDATLIDTIRVEWPSGRVQEFRNVLPKQTLTIVERTGLSINFENVNQMNLTVEGPRQQRYRVESSANLIDWALFGSVTITNANKKGSLTREPGTGENRMFFRAVPE